MKRKVPEMTTDKQAERFLEQDLSDLDFSQFNQVQFEFAARLVQLKMRVPAALLDAVKQRAKAQGIPYTRYIRELMEQAVSQPPKARPAGARR